MQAIANGKNCVVILLTLWVYLSAGDARADIISRLQSGESLTIATIGTSLSPNYGYAWPNQTDVWLNANYLGNVTFCHCAVAGSASKYTSSYTSPDSGLDVQLGNALAENPDAIFIEFAINDAYTPYQISQQMSKDNLQAMIDQINSWAADQGKTVDIIIQTMNNVVDINGYLEASKRPDLANYYQGYREVAAANGLLLIDHYPNWVDLYNSEGDHATWISYLDDYGVHPNEIGTQNVIMPEIKQALMNQVPEPGTLVLLVTGLMLIGLLAYAWRKRKQVQFS